jgi:hypothetical protein
MTMCGVGDDFIGIPFGFMHAILGCADYPIKLYGKCWTCGETATKTLWWSVEEYAFPGLGRFERYRQACPSCCSWHMKHCQIIQANSRHVGVCRLPFTECKSCKCTLMDVKRNDIVMATSLGVEAGKWYFGWNHPAGAPNKGVTMSALPEEIHDPEKRVALYKRTGFYPVCGAFDHGDRCMLGLNHTGMHETELSLHERENVALGLTPAGQEMDTCFVHE